MSQGKPNDDAGEELAEQSVLASDPDAAADLQEPFAQWAERHWDGVGRVEVERFSSPKSGYSAQTLFADLLVDRGAGPRSERAVLRLENPEPAIYPMQAPGLDVEIDIQYRTMQALHESGAVPLAPLLGYEGDASVLGRPFYVMGHVQGDVPVENPPYPSEGFFADASPNERRQLFDRGLEQLAKLHSLDWRALGFEWLLPPDGDGSAQAQLDLWERFAMRELGDRKHELLERAFHWLNTNLPSGLEPRFGWGDSRPGNIIWRDFEPVCLTDFENVAISPPEVDLGWWLMFDASMHEAVGIPRLEGEPTRDEQREMYCRHAGRDLGDTFPFEVLAAARYSAIVVRVMNRMVDRGQLPADHTIWLNNPPVVVLEGLMERA